MALLIIALMSTALSTMKRQGFANRVMSMYQRPFSSFVAVLLQARILMAVVFWYDRSMG